MKAVIMAGGMGSRLKAITGDRPKPMVPLLGRPLMEHILELLRSQGFDQVCAAVRYRAGDIMAHFGDGSRFGVEMQYRVEEEPLGTAGAVKNCRDFYGGEDFLVISGDAACDFWLSRLMEEHKRRGAAVTLALCRHSEPLSYGLAVTDGEGRIRSFVEKPDWSRVVTDLVNTGIYVISPRIMELVPEGREFDFAKDLFPLLLSRGELLLGLPMEGYWCDVGSPLSYYRCCADALEGKLRLDFPELFRPPIPSGGDVPPLPGENLDCACRSRAELMGSLSELLMDMGADYSDGLQLDSPRFHLRISPLASRSALRISVSSQDAEFARELAISARDLARALEKGGETG
ncbi:MAG TPA: nucleotidyltransferase family protein [Candidatus Limivicinus faecipullorum]|nr:nucleotidyltransferase family protein [Candidatus Limivicinus faecipullorum]